MLSRGRLRCNYSLVSQRDEERDGSNWFLVHKPHLHTDQSPETGRGGERRSSLGRPLARPGIPPRSTPTLSSPIPPNHSTKKPQAATSRPRSCPPLHPHPDTPTPRVFRTAASGCQPSAPKAPGVVNYSPAPRRPAAAAAQLRASRCHRAPGLQPPERLTGKLPPLSPTQFKALAPLGQGRRSHFQTSAGAGCVALDGKDA